MTRIKGWEKDRDSYGITTWKNIENPKCTVEIVSFESQGMYEDEEEGFTGWGYGYNAIRGKGVPSSPEFFEDKKEGVGWAIKWMRNHPQG